MSSRIPQKHESKEDFLSRRLQSDGLYASFSDAESADKFCNVVWNVSRQQKLQSLGSNFDIEEIQDMYDIFGEEAVKDVYQHSAVAKTQEQIDEAYTKYHQAVNMSYSQLKSWSENPCSKAASLSRAPINRNLKLLAKKKKDWKSSDATNALKTVAFVSRMKKVKDGKPVKTKSGGKEIQCESKRTISLKNWAYNPNKSS